MKIKTIKLVFPLIAAAVLCFAFFAKAEEESAVSINIYNLEIVSYEKNNFKLSFELANGGNIKEEMQYLVRLYEARNDSQTVTNEKLYQESLVLGGNETIKKEIDYTAPSNLKGDYELFVFAKNKNGIEIALNSAGIITLDESSIVYQNDSGANQGPKKANIIFLAAIFVIILFIFSIILIIVKKRKNKELILPLAILSLVSGLLIDIRVAKAENISFGNNWGLTANLNNSTYYPGELMDISMQVQNYDPNAAKNCNVTINLSKLDTGWPEKGTTSINKSISVCKYKFDVQTGVTEKVSGSQSYNVSFWGEIKDTATGELIGKSLNRAVLYYKVIEPPRPKVKCGSDAGKGGFTSAPTNLCKVSNQVTWKNVYGTMTNEKYYPDFEITTSQVKDTGGGWYWTCEAKNGDSFENSVSCNASKEATNDNSVSSGGSTGDGVCGTANAYQKSSNTYPITATSYGNDTFCIAGNMSDNTTNIHSFIPVFPELGKWGQRWYCLGTNGGKNTICQAKRVSACLTSTTGYCKEGTTKSNASGTSWDCTGYGDTEKCSDTGTNTESSTSRRINPIAKTTNRSTDKCQVSQVNDVTISIKCLGVKTVSISWGDDPGQSISASGDNLEILIPNNLSTNATLNVSGSYEKGFLIFKKSYQFSNNYSGIGN